MSEEEYIKQTKEKMEANIEAFRSKMRKIRTGRAQPSLLEDIRVLYYGTLTPLSRMANVTSPAQRTLVISPWDPNALKDVEQALARANLGLNPQNDGKVIRLVLPELTEERRKEIVKEIKKIAEKCRVDLRQSRRMANEEIKKELKAKTLSEDEQKRLNGKIQTITDSFMEQMENILQAKEKEILEI